MKVECKEINEFKPITLTITIESEEEFLELWHRTRAGGYTFKEYYEHLDYENRKGFCADGSLRLAGAVHNICFALNEIARDREIFQSTLQIEPAATGEEHPAPSGSSIRIA